MSNNSNVSTSFSSRLSKKQSLEKLNHLIELAASLPIEYIDTGIIDKRFSNGYGSGAGSDQDDFGKRFAFYAINHTAKKLFEHKDDFEKQVEIINNFGLATKGLAEHIFKRTQELLKARISDSVTGLANYTELANQFVADTSKDNRYFEGRKSIIENCFKVVVKPSIRRIK